MTKRVHRFRFRWEHYLIVGVSTAFLVIGAIATKSYPVHAQGGPMGMGGGMGGMGMGGMGAGAQAPAPAPPPMIEPGQAVPLSREEVELLEWSTSVERRWQEAIRQTEFYANLTYAVLTMPEVQAIRPGSAQAIQEIAPIRTAAYYTAAIRAIEARTGRPFVPEDNQWLIDMAQDSTPPYDAIERLHLQDMRAIHRMAAESGRQSLAQLPQSRLNNISAAAEAGVRRRTRLQPTDTRWPGRVQEEREDLAAQFAMGPNAASGVQRPYYRVPALPAP